MKSALPFHESRITLTKSLFYVAGCRCGWKSIHHHRSSQLSLQEYRVHESTVTYSKRSGSQEFKRTEDEFQEMRKVIANFSDIRIRLDDLYWMIRIPIK